MAAIREALLLEKRAQAANAMSDPQRIEVRACYRAGLEWLRIARDLRERGKAEMSLRLYRDSAHLLALAWLKTRDPDVDPRSTDWERTVADLRTRMGDEAKAFPFLLGEAPAFASIDHPLQLWETSREDAARLARGVDADLRRLTPLVEPRTLSEIKAARAMRLAAVALVPLAALIFFVQRAFTPTNLALHKRVTASSAAFDTAPEGAVDGDTSTRFGFHSAEESSPWLMVDLGAEYLVTRVNVLGRLECCFDQSIPAILELSVDGTSFQGVARREREFSQTEPWVVRLDGSRARFVRVRTDRRSYLVMSELQVYGAR